MTHPLNILPLEKQKERLPFALADVHESEIAGYTIIPDEAHTFDVEEFGLRITVSRIYNEALKHHFGYRNILLVSASIFSIEKLHSMCRYSNSAAELLDKLSDLIQALFGDRLLVEQKRFLVNGDIPHFAYQDLNYS